MALKPWRELSPKYRKSLERKGITASSHGRKRALKPLAELSPNYRKRLQNHGVTDQTRSLGQSMKRARGKGPETRSQISRETAKLAKLQLDQLVDAEMKMGYFPLDVVKQWAGTDLGAQRFAMVIAWQQHRKGMALAKRAETPTKDRPVVMRQFQDQFISLPDFVQQTYGPKAWNTDFAKWWDEVKDMEQWSYYN